MTDQLERDIRQLWCDSGPLDRDDVTVLLLGLLDRIQKLEHDASLKAKEQPKRTLGDAIKAARGGDAPDNQFRGFA